MDIKNKADQLENAIYCGSFASVRSILDTVCDVESVQLIEKTFKDGGKYDPLILAIKCREEDIALHLVEKGFNHRLEYNYPGQQCDQWCYYEHMEDRCPTEFDALELSQEKTLGKVSTAIQDIRLGRRMPGDGLALSQNPEFKREDSSLSRRRMRSPSATDASQNNTKAMVARRWVKEMGLNYLSRNGDTILHLCDTPIKVNVCANLGVNVNAPNFDGDIALHLSVRNDQRDVSQALLMNGADPTHKNKLGLTPLDGCSGTMRRICERFKIGLMQTIQKGEYNTLQRLIRLWCNPVSKITRDGKTAMELAESKKDESENHLRLFNLLQSQYKTLALTHAVLSEDIDAVKVIVRTEKGWSLNKRFKDKLGGTMVSYAIEQFNLGILEILVEQEYCECNLNLRVRESDEEGITQTIPIYFKALEKECPEEIWSFVDYSLTSSGAINEKDALGNTALFRAILQGKSAKFISRFIKRHTYFCLVDRNKEGFTPREYALMLKREDVVREIDSYVANGGSSYFLAEFPVNFYGFNQLPVKVTEGKMTREKYKMIEENGVSLHRAAVKGDIKKVQVLNNANYKDKNGYTALIRAVVCGQYKVAETLVTGRPVLKSIGDNCNRYPLHYAYALPEEKGEVFIKLLLQRNPEDIEYKMDKDGHTAAEYKDLRNSSEMHQMLLDVLSLDPYGKRITPTLPHYPTKSPDSDGTET